MVSVESKFEAGNWNLLQTQLMSYGNSNSSNYNPPRRFSKPTAPYLAPAYDNYFASGPGISGRLRPYIFKDALLINSESTSFNGYPTTKGKTQFYFENSSFKNVYQADASNNRIRASHFIKYFTNYEINQGNVYFDNNTQTGLLEFKPATNNARSVNDFDEQGIGAIQITDPNGITYHYALPVYTQSEVGKSFNLTNAAKDDITLKSNNVESFDLTVKPRKFASSWKLTAVTGPDYQDANNNNTADEGDTGYWIAYNYSLWDNAFVSTTNIYNYNDGFTRQATNLTRANGYGGYASPTHKKSFTIGQSVNQIYYLNFIRTSTHTAYFIKDVRLDGHSYDNVLSGTNPTPQLKLKRVILLKNTDKSLIENSAAWNLSNVDSRFNSNKFTSPADNKLIHIDKYLLNKSLIDNRSIKSVELNTDYSLSKKLYNNINNTYSSTKVNYTYIDYPTIPNWVSNAYYVLNSNSNMLYALVNKASYSSTNHSNSREFSD